VLQLLPEGRQRIGGRNVVGQHVPQWIRCKPTATAGVAWSLCLSVCLSVCLLVTFVSHAKTAEPIEMPIGGKTRVDPRNHVLDGGQDPPREGAIMGVVRPT